jgi:hypothetical protein
MQSPKGHRPNLDMSWFADLPDREFRGMGQKVTRLITACIVQVANQLVLIRI